jgi:hypothetical protein
LTKKKIIKLNGRVAKNPSEVKAYDILKEFIPKTMKVVYEEEDIPYVIQSNYKPDYRISTKKKDETVCFIEYKGGGRAFDGNARRKMLSVKEQHPDKKFFIIFHRDFKIGPKRKDGSFMKASDWSKRHGFDFCIGPENVKKEWFE